MLKGLFQKKNTNTNFEDNNSDIANQSKVEKKEESKPLYFVNGRVSDISIHLGSCIYKDNIDYREVFFIHENNKCYFLIDMSSEMHRGACMGGRTEQVINKEFLNRYNINDIDGFLDYVYSSDSSIAPCRDMMNNFTDEINFIDGKINSILKSN